MTLSEQSGGKRGRVYGKTALITGAAQGIGAACAQLLSKEGARVIVTDVLEEQGRALAESIGGIFYRLDVADPGCWESCMRACQMQGTLWDIVVNNAGITGFGTHFGPQDPEHISLGDWHRVHQINLDGVMLGCQYGIKMMKTKGGSIINLSSRSGLVGIPGASAYASSKAAIRNHTKTVALYCAQQGYRIRCNSLHPGAILTPLWDAMMGTDPGQQAATLESINAGIPLGHMGTPMDVAYAVLYLGSEESGYITGTELTLDGGILAGSVAAPQKR